MIQQHQSVQLKSQIQPQLEFLRVVCDASIKIEAISQLSDGLIFYQILSHLKHFESQSKVSINRQPSTFLHFLTNLKSILKIVQNYWFQHLHQQLLQQKQIDLIKIAKDKNVQQIKKLTKIVVRTLFHCQQRQKFIQKILLTSQTTQQYFMKIVQQQSNQNKNLKLNNLTSSSSQTSLLQKLIQLQQQNQRLLKILNQVHQEKQQIKQKQFQLQQKLEQKQKQLKKLTWQVTLFNCQKKQTIDQMYKNYSAEKKINQRLIAQIKQHQIKQKYYEEQLQVQKSEVKRMSQRLKQFDVLEQELRAQNQQNIRIKIENQNLSIKLDQLKQIVRKLEGELANQKSMNQHNGIKCSQFSVEIQKLNTLVFNKQQIIEQLQENIKFLTSSQDLSSQKNSPIEPAQPKSSIKSQCQEIINRYQLKSSHLYINKYKKQYQNLRIQLFKAKQDLCIGKNIINQLNQQINKLKMYEQENKKLAQMISHMNKYRGEENQILLKSLYKMRMKFLAQQVKRQNLDVHQQAHTKKNQTFSAQKVRKSPLEQINFNVQ